MKRRPAAASRRAAAMPAAPAPTMIVSVSPEAAGAPSAGAARTAPVPARNDRRLNDFMVCNWLPGLRRRRRLCPNAPQAANLVANDPLPRNGADEPNCNQSRLNMEHIKRRAPSRTQTGGMRVMNLMLTGIGRTIARLSAARGRRLRALHAQRSGMLARGAQARRRAAGRRQQPHLRRHQISHPVHLVACRALCRADRRAHHRGRRAAGAGRGQSRRRRGRRAAVEIFPLSHPHLPPDRADRRRLRAGLHLRRRAHRLRLRRQEHHRPDALSDPAAGAAALAAAHDGARLRPSDPHHLLGADRAGVRERALSDPAEGDPRRERSGAPRDPGNPPLLALRAARLRHFALLRAGQADGRERLRLPQPCAGPICRWWTRTTSRPAPAASRGTRRA